MRRSPTCHGGNCSRTSNCRLLIDTALAENKDLGIALARINEARANLGFVRADQFPFVNGVGRAARGRQSREIFPGADTDNDFLLGGDLSFEVDLWGRLRRSTESARAELLATEESYRNVTISLVANVASVYLLLRDLDERLEISENTVSTRLESLRIVEARFDKGTVPETRRQPGGNRGCRRRSCGCDLPASDRPDRECTANPARDVTPGPSSAVMR